MNRFSQFHIRIFGFSTGDEEESPLHRTGVDVRRRIAVGAESSFSYRFPLVVGRLYPSVPEARSARLGRRDAISLEVFHKRVIAAQFRTAGDGGECRQMFPSLIFGNVEECGILRAPTVDFGGNQKAIGVADLPIVIEERLPSGPFAAEATDANLAVLVQ